MGSPGGLEGILGWQQNAPMVYATLQQRRPAASPVCMCRKQCKAVARKLWRAAYLERGVRSTPHCEVPLKYVVLEVQHLALRPVR